MGDVLTDVVQRLWSLHVAAENAPWFYRGEGSVCVDLPGYWIAAEPADAELIAANRNALPSLLRVVEHATEVVANWKRGRCDGMVELASALRDLERLALP